MPLMTAKRWYNLQPGDIIIPTAPGSPVKKLEVVEAIDGKIKIKGKFYQTGDDYEETFIWDEFHRLPKRAKNGLPSVILSVVKILPKENRSDMDFFVSGKPRPC